MNERQKRHLLEKQEEEFLQALFDDVMEKEGQALLDASEVERQNGTLPEISEEMNAKCRELIRGSDRKHNRTQSLKGAGICFRKVAVIALVIVCFTSALVMSVDAIRLPVLNFLVDKDNRYSMVYFWSEEPEEKELSLIGKVQSAWVPEGYKLSNQWERPDGSFGFRFEDANHMTIQTSFIASSNLFNYDIEDVEQLETKVLDHDAFFIKKEGLRVIWMDEKNNGVFDIKTDGLSEKAFWKYALYVAESVD